MLCKCNCLVSFLRHSHPIPLVLLLLLVEATTTTIEAPLVLLQMYFYYENLHSNPNHFRALTTKSNCLTETPTTHPPSIQQQTIKESAMRIHLIQEEEVHVNVEAHSLLLLYLIR